MTNLITKEILLNLYHNESLSLTEIAHKFGYSQFHPIKELFTQYNIPLKTQAQLIEDKQQKKYPLPNKDNFTNQIQNIPICKLVKQYNVPLKIIEKWMKYYQLQTPYFINVNNNLKKKIFLEENTDLSPKQLSIKYNVDITTIKYYKKKWVEINYTNEEILNLLNLYDYDYDNQTFIKQIINGDISLYNSIIENTKNHTLSTNKLTERIYRIINNYQPEGIDQCKYCQSILKFYTMKLGYGNSKKQICYNCVKTYSGKGLCNISQNLFWNIYKNLNPSIECYFHELNYEKQIYVLDHDKIIINNPTLNIYRYYPDFVYGDKIIEFDGDYWHQNKEKEETKDRFYKLKGYDTLHILSSEYAKNPQSIEEQCLTFLQNS